MNLDDIKNNPILTPLPDLGKTPAYKFISSWATPDPKTEVTKLDPTEMAIGFYLLNHGMALLKAEGTFQPLNVKQAEYVSHYIESCSWLASYVWRYMLYIIYREYRHFRAWGAMSQSDIEIHKNTSALDSAKDATRDFIYNRLSKPEENHFNGLTIHEFVAALRNSYSQGQWKGGAYGGKKWAVIADLFCLWVGGTISLELLIDQCFTLCHNTGNIFNKGLFFKSCSDGVLTKILDYQAEGLIPEKLTLGSKGLLTYKPSHKYFSRDLFFSTFDNFSPVEAPKKETTTTSTKDSDCSELVKTAIVSHSPVYNLPTLSKGYDVYTGASKSLLQILEA
jgi:hypothetical protein